MIVEGYGIRLIRLTEEDIELVRKWRNSHHINRFMVFREMITEEQQKKWFSSIDNIHNNYFIIMVDGNKIGLINGAKIDWDTKETGSGGIFIWEDSYWQTTLPVMAALLLTDTSVFLGLERTYATVLRSNKNAISFNKMLGYKVLSDQGDMEAQHYVLERKDYLVRREQLRTILRVPDSKGIKITFENNEEPVNQFYIRRLSEVPDQYRDQFEVVIEEVD